MTTRREKVLLELEDRFSSEMMAAATKTALLNRELNSLSGTAVRTSRTLDDTDREVTKVTKSAERGGREIDRYSGRLAALAQAAAILGPALVPIGAIGIPAVGGLANGFAAAALGAGTAVLAFQGVGDALKSLNTAALDPTAQNLEKAQFALEQLSPAAQGFVVELRSMMPALNDLKAAAASGMFPGLTDAIEAMESRLPVVEEILQRIGSVLGDLARDGGEALAGPQWDDFMSFIAREGPMALEAMGRSVGALTHGLAELWMAFAPLDHSFSAVMLRASQSFDKWATGLSKTQGFEEFIEYLNENGPRVADALAAIGNAVLQIVEAAAPLGGAVIEALTGVANAIAAIADSKAGPAIMETVTALALLNRGMATFSAISSVSWVKAARGAEGFSGKLGAMRSPLLRGGVAVAGLGLAASGAADKFDMANTMSLAFTGSLAGPWGTAIGAGIGLMLDFGKSHDYTAATTSDLIATLNQETGAITKNTRAYVANALEKSGALEAASALGISLSDVTSAALGNSAAIGRVNAALTAASTAFQTTDARTGESLDTVADYRDNVNTLGGSISELRGKLTQATGEQGRIAEATAEATAATRGETAALRANVAAFNRKVTAMAAAFDAETQYRQALKDAREQAAKNNAGIRGSTDAALANRGALSQLAAAWNNQSDAVRNNHARFREARTAFIETATAMGVPKKAAIELAHRLLEIPRQRVIDVALRGERDALSAIARIKAQMASVPRSVRTDFYVNQVNAINRPKLYADGGFTGPGGKYEPAGIVHRGEVVIPQEYVKRDWSSLKARYGDLPGMATGGLAGSTYAHTDPATRAANSLADGLNRARESLKKEYEGRAKLLSSELSREKERLQMLKDERQAMVDAVSSAFHTDVFGGSDSGGIDWASTGLSAAAIAAMQQTQRDNILTSGIADKREALRLLRVLHKRGLDGPAYVDLAATGDVATLQAYADMSRQQLRQYERRYETDLRLERRIGSYVGDVERGPQIAAQAAAVRETNQHLKHVQHEIKLLRKDVKDAAEKNAKDVTAGVNGAATSGHKNRRH